MEKRLLGRNEGRTDDNIETIRKRFKVFIESSMPVVSHYESQVCKSLLLRWMWVLTPHLPVRQLYSLHVYTSQSYVDSESKHDEILRAFKELNNLP